MSESGILVAGARVDVEGGRWGVAFEVPAVGAVRVVWAVAGLRVVGLGVVGVGEVPTLLLGVAPVDDAVVTADGNVETTEGGPVKDVEDVIAVDDPADAVDIAVGTVDDEPGDE